MPNIFTAQEAIETSDRFLSKYYSFARPTTARKEGDIWLVVFNVGVFQPEKVQLRIDSNTGDVVEFDDLSTI